MSNSTSKGGRLDKKEGNSIVRLTIAQTEADPRLSDKANAIHQLAEQIGQIAARLDSIAKQDEPQNSDPLIVPTDYTARDGNNANTIMLHNARPKLADAQRIRTIIRHRQNRAQFFKSELFADPAWDMLLDLAAARMEHIKVSVTSLCIASGVPDTTALRWISVMIDEGLFERVNDETDKRRVFIELTAKANRAVTQYFQSLGNDWNLAS